MTLPRRLQAQRVAAWPEPDPSRPRLRIPPAIMPMAQRGRPLKRWSYVGIFTEDAMLCAGEARIGPLHQSFWAFWDRQSATFDTGTLFLRPSRVRVGTRSVVVRSGDARMELALTPAGDPVEVVSPHGDSYIWTRKVPVRADGHFAVDTDVRTVTGYGLMDLSAGYHARHTAWEWSAGCGTTTDGWPVIWNLVHGLHDSDTMSERTVWVNGVGREVPPVRFSDDLDRVWGMDGSSLAFEEEASRTRRDEFGLVSSDYVQPFGTFSGVLPGGVELSSHEPALGVMERHRARW